MMHLLRRGRNHVPARGPYCARLKENALKQDRPLKQAGNALSLSLHAEVTYVTRRTVRERGRARGKGPYYAFDF